MDKHDKDSPEGRGLRALREIRVQATPGWDEGSIELFFWFIRHEDTPDFEGRDWADLRDKWLGLVTPSGQFIKVEGQVAALEDLKGSEYVGSDPLDLDHLSS
ncbi:hypothetical protein G4177_29700 [Corallococcus sp. ZKHCc1 1396]|uniref:Uncharacterized protein n=1 Tax=Corallococcus soli TaxID=2710757 RepID=A0ABR9PWP3_9BACT|nr:hypothetical protein [Corallococcus soli]MBE4752348.1 hypothetical protein [Corallococcus soli]